MLCSKCGHNDCEDLETEIVCCHCKYVFHSRTRIINCIPPVRTLNISDRKYYVYFWYDDIGDLIYIGKGTGNRAYTHHGLCNEPKKPKVIIYKDGLNEREALCLEANLIKKHLSTYNSLLNKRRGKKYESAL